MEIGYNPMFQRAVDIFKGRKHVRCTVFFTQPLRMRADKWAMLDGVVFLVTDGGRYLDSVSKGRIRWRNRFSEVIPMENIDDAERLIEKASRTARRDIPGLRVQGVSERLFRLANAACA
jgi:hypothetical protein